MYNYIKREFINRKDYSYNEYLEKGLGDQLDYGISIMEKEVSNAPLFIKELLRDSIESYKLNQFKYDGATLVKEIHKGTLFEAGSFSHDYFNSMGYVGYNVDILFIIIMLILEYPKWMVVKRIILMFCFTWINVLRRKYRKDLLYLGDIKLKDYVR